MRRSDLGGQVAISAGDVRQAMSELGELRFGATPVQDAMDRIVQTTHVLFDVDGAGLMLADDDQQLRSVAVSDDRFRHLEEIQLAHDEGPCIAAYDDKQLICVEDLEKDDRWPHFGPAAVDRGVRAVLASPIPFNQQAIGVVGVVSQDSRPWSPEGELALLAFTDLAALLIASMLRAEEKSELATQLQGALDSRAVIEQAKGVLIGQHGISARQAYEQLRDRSRRERQKLSLVAAGVVEEAARR
ncbi:ANTAR domain-containing protein [Jatrophihabitans sp. DSM 45814]